MKRAVWGHVRSGHAHVSNPEEYAAVAQQRNPNIYIEFVSKSSIKDMYSFLDAKWEGVKAVSVMHPSAATTGNGPRQRTKFTIRMTVLCG